MSIACTRATHGRDIRCTLTDWQVAHRDVRGKCHLQGAFIDLRPVTVIISHRTNEVRHTGTLMRTRHHYTPVCLPGELQKTRQPCSSPLFVVLPLMSLLLRYFQFCSQSLSCLILFFSHLLIKKRFKTGKKQNKKRWRGRCGSCRFRFILDFSYSTIILWWQCPVLIV